MMVSALETFGGRRRDGTTPLDIRDICITRNPAIAEGPRDAGVPVEIW